VRTILVSADDPFPPISRTLSISLARPEPAGNAAGDFAEEFDELARLMDYHEFNGISVLEPRRCEWEQVAAALGAFEAIGGIGSTDA
jgi:hypothetical protein